MKKQPKRDRDYLLYGVLLLAILFVNVPWIVNVGLANWRIKTAEGLGSADWLLFWGTYIGSALGVMVTLAAFAFTYRQNERQNREIREQNTRIQEQNRVIQQQLAEAAASAIDRERLQAMPFIDIRRGEETTPEANVRSISLDYDGFVIEEEVVVGSVMPIRLGNIGVGPAIGLELSGEHIGHLPVGDSVTLCLNLPMVNYMSYLQFTLSFSDRAGGQYVQTVYLKHADESYDIFKITPPVPR